GLDTQFDGLVIDKDSRLGIFGQLVAPTQVLRDGERVEIYRPLLADPKEVRKERAARAKARRDPQSGD
ncbi:MAG: RnfH family protein, partial [Congregibacter sp.]|nr:RnfH family protein [Congregibacter sp.]